MSLEALVDELSSELPGAAAQAQFKTLLNIFGRILDNPAEPKFRALQRQKLQGKLHGKSLQLLLASGFEERSEEIVLSQNADLQRISELREVLNCLILSYDDGGVSTEPAAASAASVVSGDAGDDAELQEALTLSMRDSAPQAPGGSAGPAGEEEDPEVLEALRLSMGEVPREAPPKRARSSEPGDATEDQALAERLAKEEEPKDVAFERFRAEDVLVDPDAVEKINTYCRERGEQYVDPQFPPASRSLYLDKADANSWRCFTCGSRTEFPPVPPLPSSQEEAEKNEEDFKTKVKCSGCGEAAPFVVKVQFFNRPTQWLRPGTSCQGCEMLYAHLPGAKELVSRMCPHFLRDPTAGTTVGAPWKLIRSEARAEDVCQGGLGNCWFAGALSVVARCPALIDKMFETKDFNPCGAYQLQLCHAGNWRRILIDDLLPTSQVFEGYIDGNTAYYSRGGTLCYLHCARRQLWVPLVEKAAAKLFGCYAALKSGTFGEALALFTGFPTDKIPLYVHKEVRRRRVERRAAEAERRTQLLLRGLEVPDDPESEDDLEDDDLKWTRIMSANESGYLMGIGCTEEGCEKSKHHIVEDMGLQAPHAYGVLDAHEIEVDGKIVRLMKIRNPWGERAPRTWKGDWGKDSPKWTFDLKLALGVVNSSNVKMDDDMSVFWMAFEDVKEYFGAVEVCRVHLGWSEERTTVWLPSGVGPGEAADVTVFRKTQVDVVLWQERHITREGALGAKSTNIDVGFVVLRHRGPTSDREADWDLVKYVRRSRADDVSSEMILEEGYVYRVVPISYGLAEELAPRRAVLAIHSVQKVEVTKVQSSWRDIAWGVLAGCRKHGKKRPIEGAPPPVSAWILSDEAGLTYAVENTSEQLCAVQVDASDSVGCVSSRGSMEALVAIPPRSRQVVIGLAFARGATRIATMVQSAALPGEAASFALLGEDLHAPLPLAVAGRPTPVPDEEILRRAPPEAVTVNQRDLVERAASSEDLLLAQALQLSLAARPTPTAGALGELQELATASGNDDEDDELAFAIKLSLANPPAAESRAESSAEAPRSPSKPQTPDAKAKMQQRVKQLFEQYRASGMPPNEAAVRAMRDAQGGL